MLYGSKKSSQKAPNYARKALHLHGKGTHLLDYAPNCAGKAPVKAGKGA